MDAQQLVLPEFPDIVTGLNLGRIAGAYPVIPAQLLSSALKADPKVFCGEINSITGCAAAEAIESFIQLQAGAVVIMEGTPGHAVPAHIQSVILCGLYGRYCRAYGFEVDHLHFSFPFHFREKVASYPGKGFLSYYIYVEIREKRSNHLTVQNQKT